MNTWARSTVRCPGCGRQAIADLAWRRVDSTMQVTIRNYRCPTGCQVEDDAIRRLIGVS